MLWRVRSLSNPEVENGMIVASSNFGRSLQRYSGTTIGRRDDHACCHRRRQSANARARHACLPTSYLRGIFLPTCLCGAYLGAVAFQGLLGPPNVVESPEFVDEAPPHGDEGIVRRGEEGGRRREGRDGGARGGGDAGDPEPRLAPGGAHPSEAVRNHREFCTSLCKSLTQFTLRHFPLLALNR